MRHQRLLVLTSLLLSLGLAMGDVLAQRDGPQGERRGREGRQRGEFGGPGGQRGFGGGRRGPGGPGGRDMLRALPIMAALDADEDGEISQSEIANAVAALQALDKNKDGKLTREELTPKFGPGGPGGPGGRANRGGPGGRDVEAILDRIFAADKNGDKKLSKEEAPEMLQARFADADLDDDGFLTREELTDAMRQLRQRRGGPGDGRGGERPERRQRPE